MRNLEGPIPLRPTDTNDIGGIYGELQLIRTAKALALKNTDLKVKPLIKALNDTYAEMYESLNNDIDLHISVTKKAVHGENKINTLTYNINDYPLANHRDIDAGGTYEAYITPDTLHYAVDHVKRNPNPNHQINGTTQITFANSNKLMNGELETSNRDFNPKNQGLMNCQIIHNEGRLFHIVPTNDIMLSMTGVCTDPIVAVKNIYHHPMRNLEWNSYGVGDPISPERLKIKADDGGYYFYLSHPILNSVNPKLGVCIDNDNDIYTSIKEDYDSYLLVEDFYTLFGKVSIDETGIKCKVDMFPIEMNVNDDKLATVPYVGYGIEKQLKTSYLDIEGDVSDGNFTWASLFNGNETEVKYIDGLLVLLQQSSIGEHTYNLYAEARVSIGGEVKIIRIHFPIDVDLTRREVTVSWSDKYGHITVNDGKMVGTSGWFYDDIEPGEPFEPTTDRRIFLNGVGSVSSLFCEGVVGSRYWVHDCDTLESFIQNLPKLPKIKETVFKESAIESYSQDQHISRPFQHKVNGVVRDIGFGRDYHHNYFMDENQSAIYNDADVPYGILQDDYVLKSNVFGSLIGVPLMGEFRYIEGTGKYISENLTFAPNEDGLTFYDVINERFKASYGDDCEWVGIINGDTKFLLQFFVAFVTDKVNKKVYMVTHGKPYKDRGLFTNILVNPQLRADRNKVWVGMSDKDELLVTPLTDYLTQTPYPVHRHPDFYINTEGDTLYVTGVNVSSLFPGTVRINGSHRYTNFSILSKTVSKDTVHYGINFTLRSIEKLGGNTTYPDHNKNSNIIPYRYNFKKNDDYKDMVILPSTLNFFYNGIYQLIQPITYCTYTDLAKNNNALFVTNEVAEEGDGYNYSVGNVNQKDAIKLLTIENGIIKHHF